MIKLTRKEFLALRAGAVFIDRSPDSMGPTLKGETLPNNSFMKSGLKVDSLHRLKMVEGVHDAGDQLEFYVLDDTEVMVAAAMLFSKIAKFSQGEYMATVEKLITGFTRSQNASVKMPDGKLIAVGSSDVGYLTMQMIATCPSF